MGVRYSVWRNKDDQPICIGATSIKAAKAMGCPSLNCFYSTVSKNLSGKRRKYTIIKEDDSNA